MSRTDNTQPPKFGGRGAFVESRHVHSPDPDRATIKGHPRESWARDRKAWWRRTRRVAQTELAQVEEPEPAKPHHEVQYDRW